MDAQAIWEEARRLGISLRVVGDRIRYRPKSAAPPDLVEALYQHKAEILAVLVGQSTTWPPPDAADLVGRWEALAHPGIPLSPGVRISDLERWLTPAYNLPTWEPEHIGQVRRFLLEYLP